MPSGKDITGGGSSGGGGGNKRNGGIGAGGGGGSPPTTTGGAKKNAYCSFCRKSYRDVGPLVEGPGDVYICGECIELCQSILDQERRRRGVPKTLFTDIPTPREIKEQLMDRTRVPRDCFPSLHTCLTVLLMWGAWRHARSVFWALLPFTVFIPFACVYLRYHYVADVLAGLTLFAIVALVAPPLQRRYEKRCT